MLQSDFVIDQVSWHTSIDGNPESPAMVRERFRVLVSFLQQHLLTTKVLLQPNEEPSDFFSIRKSDLTDRGFAVIQQAYDKWLKTVINKRKNPKDTSLFEAALAKL